MSNDKDESYHPEWTLSPQHHAVLKDMRAAGEKRRQREQDLDQYLVGRGIHAPLNK